MDQDEIVSLLITLGLVAAGVLVTALLVDWTMRRYVILAPAKPGLSIVEDEASDG